MGLSGRAHSAKAAIGGATGTRANQIEGLLLNGAAAHRRQPF
jgi:hypothetical protein